jgi:hypothetical protein
LAAGRQRKEKNSEHPKRIREMILDFNPTSTLLWKSTFYTLNTAVEKIPAKSGNI